MGRSAAPGGWSGVDLSCFHPPQGWSLTYIVNYSWIYDVKYQSYKYINLVWRFCAWLRGLQGFSFVDRVFFFVFEITKGFLFIMWFRRYLCNKKDRLWNCAITFFTAPRNNMINKCNLVVKSCSCYIQRQFPLYV